MEIENKQSLIDSIKDMTKVYLDELCEGEKYEYICKLKQTPKGLIQIQDYVVSALVSKEDYTIADALFDKERSLNPNIIND